MGNPTYEGLNGSDAVHYETQYISNYDVEWSPNVEWVNNCLASVDGPC